MPNIWNNKTISGEMFVLLASVLWGTTGTSQALAPANAHPLSIAAIRITIGGIALLLITLAGNGFRFDKPRITANTVIAAVCVAAYQVFFFSAVSRTGVAVGTIVGIGSSPIFGGIIGFLFRKETLGKRWFAATAIAITGTVLLVSSNRGHLIDPVGILLALGAGFAYAVYVLTSKSVMASQTIQLTLAIIFTIGGLLLAPLLFLHDMSWLWQPRGLAVGLNLGITTVAIAYTLFARGLSTLPVSKATTLTLAEPLTAALLGIFYLNETITIRILSGLLMVFIGLMLLVWHPQKQETSGLIPVFDSAQEED